MAKTYNPKKVIITYNGIPVTGYADGSFIKIKRNKDAFTLVVGADGEVARVASADKSGEMELTLMQTSASNNVLSAACALDELTDANTGIFMMKDINGQTLCLGRESWIKKQADVDDGMDKGDRVWVFATGNLDMLVGVN